MSLSPEIRRRIFEEEELRSSARERLAEEIRLRKQNSAFVVRALVLLVIFALSYFLSNIYLARPQSIPEVAAPAASSRPQVAQTVLDEVTEILKPGEAATVCARTVTRGRPQVKGTIELSRDLSRSTSRRIALDKVRLIGAALRRHGLAIPAYVEVVSPKRWYGVAYYDSDTLRISWDTCPGRCEQEGTERVRRCPL